MGKALDGKIEATMNTPAGQKFQNSLKAYSNGKGGQAMKKQMIELKKSIHKNVKVTGLPKHHWTDWQRYLIPILSS